MKKTANTLKYLMALFLFLGMGHHTFAQCTDDHGLVAFTGYQIGDTDFTTVKKDAFSFVVLDYLPAKTAIHFTDRGWLVNAFQTYGQATTDGQLTWSSDEAIPGGQHIVITLDGINSKASKGNITKYEGNFELGISGDQLFAYTETLKIHAAMLINRTAWDTDPSIQNLGYLSSSVSLDPNNTPRQSVIVANIQGSPAVDQENAFQAKLSPITIAGSRAGLRTQLFAAPFTILAGGQAADIQLASSPITWNAALSTYSSMTLGNKRININGVIDACYYQWQSSTDNVTFTDVSEDEAFADTQKPNLFVKNPLTEDTWFRVILRGAQQTPSEAKLVKALKITTQPVDAHTCAYTNVSLKVEAVGEGNLKYQWKIRNRTTGNSDFISDGVVYSGTNTNTLILKAPPYSMNNYAYICVITDELGFSNESSEGVLTVSNLHATATVADVSCHGTATGAIDVTPAGGTAPYTYDWGNGTTTQDRVNLVAGSYTVTITDSKGCQYSLSATVTGPVAALQVDEPTLTAPTVYGATDGRIQITVSGGTAAYSYQWFKNGESAIIAITKDLVNIGAGLYSVVVTDAKGCQQKIDNIILTNPNAKPVVISSGGSTAFTEGQLAVVVDAGLTVTDPDNTTLATATVSIRGNFQSGQDVLEFTNNGTTMGNIAAVLYNKATGVLTLSSAGATATVAQWQAALRAVKYDNLSQNPSTANRTISFTVSDGDLESISATKIVSVTSMNDAPVNSVPGTQSVDQDAILVFSAANNNQISVSDVDAGANAVQVALTATNGLITLSGTSGLSVSIGSGTNDVIMIFNGTLADINNALNGLIFEPTPGYNGPASLQITTDDLGNTGSGGRQTATNTIAITVKPINPKIVSVGASTADGTYKIGDDIKLVVTFDQTVMVNTEGGIPTLLLETGAIDRMSTYVSGNGSNTLTFIYTVQAGDRAPDLDYQSTSALSLNGASIKNSGGNDAVLTLPAVGGPKSIAGQHAIVIDGVRPTVASVALPANGYYVLNQNLDFTVNFSEAVVVNTIGGTPGLSLTIGGQTAYANYLSGSGSTALEFRYVVINDLEDHDGITVSALSLNGSTISDAAGNDANLTLNSVGSTTGVKVDAKPPAVPAGLKAIGQHAQISLTWESNTEADLKKYMLYVKPKDEARLFLTDIAKGTEYYTHAGLVDGKTYEFFLVAVDQVGNRSLEAQASAKTMAEQSINFAALPDLTYGQQAVVLTAAATSNLPVSFVSSDVDIAEVYQDNNDGGKWKINVKKTGKVQITAIQGGDQAYLPAAPVVRDLTIMKAEQTIRFIGPDMLARDAGQVSLDVSASSGLPVVLSVDDPSVATVSGTQVKVLRLGTVRITATQLGNENYAAAAPVTVTVRIANDAAAPLPIRVHQALSPNGDGVNDFLTIEGIQDYPENKVTIFDKSGSVLAEIASYNNRDRVFSGNDHRDGTYFYYIDVKDNGVWKREKGYFVIRR